jgi:hypothetical protein
VTLAPGVSSEALVLVVDGRRFDPGFYAAALAANVIRHAEVPDRKAYRDLDVAELKRACRMKT